MVSNFRGRNLITKSGRKRSITATIGGQAFDEVIGMSLGCGRVVFYMSWEADKFEDIGKSTNGHDSVEGAIQSAPRNVDTYYRSG